jgi:hypothetical protein
MVDQNEFNDRRFLLDHSASWSDARTALYLTLALVAVMGTLVLFFPGTSPAPHAGEEPSATSEGRAIIRDPGRAGWRGLNGAWNTLGTHEAVGSLDAVPDETEPER